MNAQVQDQAQANNLTQSLLGSISAINLQQLTPQQVQDYANGYIQTATNYLNNKPVLITQEQYKQVVDAAVAKINSAQQPKPITIAPIEMVSPKRPQGDGWTGPRIQAIFQTMLGVTPDTKLGRQTQAALDMYKKNRNPGMSNELAFEYLKQEPEYRTRRPMQYDDTNDVYLKSPQIPVREAPF